MRHDEWDDLDAAFQRWFDRNCRWVMVVLVVLLVVVVSSIRFECQKSEEQRNAGFVWNTANASVPAYIWNLSNPSPNLLQPAWNRNNPTPVCTSYTGPNYRPDGDQGYNPPPLNTPWKAQPNCYDCHGNNYVAFVNYTAVAGSDGHPLAVGGM